MAAAPDTGTDPDVPAGKRRSRRGVWAAALGGGVDRGVEGEELLAVDQHQPGPLGGGQSAHADPDTLSFR